VPIRPSRKILCIGLLLACTIAAGVEAPPTAGTDGDPGTGSDLRRVSLSQAGRDLVVSVRTEAPLGLARLDPTPAVRAGGDRLLCLVLHAAGRRGSRRLCLGGPKAHRRAGLELVNARGGTVERSTVPVHLKRPEKGKLVVALEPSAAELRPQRYRWRAIENRFGCEGCRVSFPPLGFREFRLRPVRPVGCTGGHLGLVTNGSRDHRVVSLTFDDGPSDYTEGFLDVLRDKHVHATFFEIGQEVPGREEVMRRLLHEGSEIGNHTTHHDSNAGYADLEETNSLIRAATHFRPCLFRPPGGAAGAGVLAAAGEAGMETVTWDVDPSDWTDPGSGVVYRRVVDAVQPGSIVVMHDGGGDRRGTLAALPSIIDTLRDRGYRFATVTELLGHHLIYRPYG
jgi:peptidoglycan/xylan/chitin deacetylase (PgdA/CDA1 family)